MPVPRVADIDLRPPRVRPPDSLARICTVHPHVRVAHTYGKAYRDVIRALRGEFANAPDLEAFPDTEEQIGQLLDWTGCSRWAGPLAPR